ncbi:MAG: glycosyltransferase family 9 protein [Bryobacterales bacterium]|nr:glycosyltransferase family 9 protein [Bryobacterales bacterium]
MLVVDSLPARARVLIVRLRSLGDCVLTTPALHLLKRARPDLEISVLVEDRFAPVFTGNPDLTAVLPPTPSAALSARPHLTLNLHGGPRSAWLTLASLARRRAGFAHYRVGQWAYNLKLPRAQEVLGEERAVHTAEHLAAAVFALGVPRGEVPRARLFAPPAPRRAPYAVIHAFASQLDKTWPADRFAAVARHLREDLRLEPVFIGAAPDDFSPFAGFETVRGAPLKEAMTLLSGASLFIGNDSGPAHMAAAFGLPLVVLFGSSHVDQWRPWRTEAETIVSPPDVRVVPVAQVQAAVERLKVRAA